MAQARMIHGKISVSEQVNNLSDKAKIIYTWSIAHTDDVGLLKHNHDVLRSIVVPMWIQTPEEFSKCVSEIEYQQLYEHVIHGKKSYYRVKNFSGHQTLKRDRRPKTILEIELNKDVKKAWAQLEKVVSKLDPVRIQNGSKTALNIIESNGIESNKREYTPQDKKTTDEDVSRETPTKKPNPVFAQLEFFQKACKALRGMEAQIDKGKDLKLIKKRLSELEGDSDRFEKLTVWYLTRQKRDKDEKGRWYAKFKNPPTMSTMLANSWWGELLTDERNVPQFNQDVMMLYEALFPKVEIKSAGGSGSARSIGELLDMSNFRRFNQ